MKRTFSFLGLFLFLAVPLSLGGDDILPVAQLSLTANDRVLVIAPHPDDEVLGAGGILQKAVSMKLPVKVAFLTHGDSNQWSFLLYRRHPVVMPRAVQQMGLIRRDEAVSAAEILGVGAENITFLGYPDFGALTIWYKHWNERPPYKSLLTQVTKVPYQGALRYGAPYKGEEILTDIRSLIHDFKPTKIFVSHPADHNGDHLAAYLFLRVALWDEGLEDKVEVYPYLIHFLGWPKPKGFHPQIDLVPPKALYGPINWMQHRLSPIEFDLKKAALQSHQSQYKSSPLYLLSFVKNNELFGDFQTIHLKPSQDASVFNFQHKVVPSVELPDEFNSREKAAYVGVEWKFLRWQGDNLVISIDLSKPLAQDVEASIYIFGYNKNIPFKEMPKISVNLGVLSHSVYDQSKRIDHGAIKITRTANEVTLEVPLSLLGNPDRLLTSARTYLGNVPLGAATWVAVELY